MTNESRPLIDSVVEHEPLTTISVIANGGASGFDWAYPDTYEPGVGVLITHTNDVLCYAAALNRAKEAADEFAGPHEWYIFLGNDTLCTAPFHDILKRTPPAVMAGSGIYKIVHYKYISGWGMVIHHRTWETVGRFDENYIISAWEDVDYAYRVQLAGLRLHKIEDWPIIHMDQQQRQVKFPINHVHIWNGAYFERKHNIPAPLCRYLTRWRLSGPGVDRLLSALSLT
jgi:GT2 family glycosyltransferase